MLLIMRLIYVKLNHFGPVKTENLLTFFPPPSLCRQLMATLLMQVSELLHVFVRTRECHICCSPFCSAALSFAPCSLLSPLSSLPSLSRSHSFSLSRSCLFHRAPQSLTINKLYVSLCIIPKAPFRKKKTLLICPWASVYPKWLHETRSWLSGRPDRPCWLLTHHS